MYQSIEDGVSNCFFERFIALRRHRLKELEQPIVYVIVRIVANLFAQRLAGIYKRQNIQRDVVVKPIVKQAGYNIPPVRLSARIIAETFLSVPGGRAERQCLAQGGPSSANKRRRPRNTGLARSISGAVMDPCFSSHRATLLLLLKDSSVLR